LLRSLTLGEDRDVFTDLEAATEPTPEPTINPAGTVTRNVSGGTILNREPCDRPCTNANRRQSANVDNRGSRPHPPPSATQSPVFARTARRLGTETDRF